jgi:GTPase Era involved in 16S rRNA processing
LKQRKNAFEGMEYIMLMIDSMLQSRLTEDDEEVINFPEGAECIPKILILNKIDRVIDKEKLLLEISVKA